jgi:hypothetical protein
VGEAAREQRGAALLGVPIRGEVFERTVVCGDRVGNTAVSKGGRAGGEFIRTIRVQSGDRWE